ncbi:sugar phosphate isomerase/epimerase [Sinomonas sp. ASV322]|uniref:sugar phosphate isomerase/epimerase family protein n=1 Tax=Sinomonas sp. ASV322 TaxID=3041920 RepID=UPI0027DAF3E6|nr:sugar phosphate isomerase/epimerase [Sinomonas sp. ASV322]MDQ4500716.1 sugar phosphate isomerase/epimerase [Sinomonas sp. ASV322]
MYHSRLGCSSISFRHLDLPSALATMAGAGFEEIDLGALPGVCDHVPYTLDREAVAAVSADVARSGLRVRSVNGDIGDLNAPLSPEARRERREHLDRLLDLAEAVEAEALVLPCGALDHEPVASLDADLDLVAAELSTAAEAAAARGLGLWTESLHVLRLSWNLDRALALSERLDGTGVRHVLDSSHAVASGGGFEAAARALGPRIAHVHLRDAVPGDIHRSIGAGDVDFAGGLGALRELGYDGHFTLELETRDLTHDERPAAAAKAASFISGLI